MRVLVRRKLVTMSCWRGGYRDSFDSGFIEGRGERRVQEMTVLRMEGFSPYMR